MQTMSTATARRTALAAQGFTDARPAGQVTRQHLNRVLGRTKLLQLDSVNVAVRAHYMPLFSRLGAYSARLLDDAAWNPTAAKPRLLVEYWAHEASLIPVADWPLLRWRMREHGGSWRRRARELLESSPGLVDDVLAAVKDLGPVGAGTLERELGGGIRQGRGPWWNRTETKRVCELLFATGELTTGTRKGFERRYDLPERVLPPEVLAQDPPEDEAIRELVRRSATALGVATETDLRDYYRLGPQQARQAIAELIDGGELEPVAVRGWQHQAYLHSTARTPRRVQGHALLCPFDPVVWERSRAERLFGFRYRIEIYVPEAKREYGYYVFPFLRNGELVARVDLKADRAAKVLRVPGAFTEPGREAGAIAPDLAEALTEMAAWLELDGVEIGERGDQVLTAALRDLTRGDLTRQR
ncbi:winged helix-turn-helix domain-containing protein [Saccharopolyspora sp. MS10]|uniref:winged helix-turn-helix domain-containing protein n=1 Tax=Saccharopolyspora sp. MS10 TaxID=3385973 RepID=UPI00399F6A42